MSIHIAITPTKTTAKGQRYEARLDGEVVTISKTPFLSAARVLLEQGHSPDTILAMSRAVSDTGSLRATLGAAAKLTVMETETVGPRFGRYRPPPAGMPFATMTGEATGASRRPAR
jgi:hypothetical protein